jgi:NAD-specific glutamate dehydrogenase
MGLFTGLLTLPLAPVRGTVWIAERLLEEAERELNDPAVIEQRLEEAEAALERGEVSEEEFEALEEELLGRLTGQGGWYGAEDE